MRNPAFRASVLTSLALAFSMPAGAGIPSASNSTVDPCIVACPAGDVAFKVITRHLDDAPWNEGPVTLSFCGCPGLRLEPRTSPYAIEADGCTASEVPASDGTSLFPIAAGGLCVDLIRVDAEGILMGSRPVASFDQDGDWTVSSADLAIIQSKIATNDPTADFDADGLVTAADVAIAQTHLGHSGVPTGVGPGPVVRGGVRFSRPPSPNPARGPVAFSVVIPEENPVEITIVDLTGRRVATLWSGSLAAGEHAFVWKGDTSRGASARSGLYLARLRTGDVAVAKLFSLLR